MHPEFRNAFVMEETSDAEVLVESDTDSCRKTHLKVPWQWLAHLCWMVHDPWKSGHTRLLRKSQLLSYCDASCSNVGQCSYYYHITEKVQCTKYN